MDVESGKLCTSLRDTQEPPSFLELEPRQSTLYKALSLKDVESAAMYLGAVRVLQQIGNPDRVAQSAFSIRELMDRIPSFLDVAIEKKTSSLTDKVTSLQAAFRKTIKNTKNHSEKRWNGAIDGHLAKLLIHLEDFVGWFGENRSIRRIRTEQLLMGLDPSRTPLPNQLLGRNVDIWNDLYNYFNKTLHHNHKPTGEEFSLWLAALEGFLVDRLSPRTYDDQDFIDQIIKEGEAGD